MIPETMVIIGLSLVLAGLVLFAIGLYFYKKKQVIADTPTSKIRSVAIGLVELVGQGIPIQ